MEQVNTKDYFADVTKILEYCLQSYIQISVLRRHFSYKHNLKHYHRLNVYLKELVEAELLTTKGFFEKTRYKTTQQGYARIINLSTALFMMGVT